MTIGFRVLARRRKVDADTVAKFRALPVANVSDVMSRMTAGGARLRPLHAGGPMAGPALTVKAVTIKSARGHSFRSCELALQQIASKRFPLERITTHRFGLKDADLAIKSVGGQGLPDVIHASLMPWM